MFEAGVYVCVCLCVCVCVCVCICICICVCSCVCVCEGENPRRSSALCIPSLRVPHVPITRRAPFSTVWPATTTTPTSANLWFWRGPVVATLRNAAAAVLPLRGRHHLHQNEHSTGSLLIERRAAHTSRDGAGGPSLVRKVVVGGNERHRFHGRVKLLVADLHLEGRSAFVVSFGDVPHGHRPLQAATIVILKPSHIQW